jgi:hypothetical protein
MTATGTGSTTPSIAGIPPPPRAIRRRRRNWALRLFAQLLLWASLAATLYAASSVIEDVLILAWAVPIDAQVESVHDRRDPFTDGRKYVARYHYAGPDGGTHAGESRITWAAFRRMADPRTGNTADEATFAPGNQPTLRILVFAAGPLRLSRAAEDDTGHAFRIAARFMLPALLLLAIVLYIGVVLRPARVRWLYREGAAAEGNIVQRRKHRSRHGTVYFADYAFRPPEAQPRQAFGGTTVLPNKAAFMAITAGQRIVVLYKPGNPAVNVAYELGPYEWA